MQSNVFFASSIVRFSISSAYLLLIYFLPFILPLVILLDKILDNILENDYQLKYGYYLNKSFDSITEAIQYDILNLDYLEFN